jgi:hypothetical protein
MTTIVTGCRACASHSDLVNQRATQQAWLSASVVCRLERSWNCSLRLPTPVWWFPLPPQDWAQTPLAVSAYRHTRHDKMEQLLWGNGMVTAVRYPPGPKSTWPGGQIFAFRRDAIGLYTGMARDYGDIVAYRLGAQRSVLLNHPEYIRDVLVTQQRHFWRWGTAVYWGRVCLDGRHPDPGDVGATLAVTPRARASGGTATADYLASQAWDAHDIETALGRGTACTHPPLYSSSKRGSIKRRFKI